jgi:type IV pilus assembly protein PilX
MRNSSPRQNAATRQQGVALAVALILLIIVTLIGLAAVRGTTVQQRMTANFYDRELAFQNTEAALRAGEALIQAGPVAGVTSRDCTTTQCEANPFTDPNLNAALIQTVATTEYTAGSNAPGQPQYVVELICTNCPYTAAGASNFQQSANFQSYGTQPLGGAAFQFYRVTARSSNPGDSDYADRAVVTLQSLIVKPL